MASKRNIRKKACAGKVRYASSTEAHKVRAHLPKDNKRVNVYHCQFCNGFHIGHAKRWVA